MLILGWCFAILLCTGLVLGVLLTRKPPATFTPLKAPPLVSTSGFQIRNHLPEDRIRVSVRETKKGKSTPLVEVAPQGSSTLTPSQVDEYLQEGNMILIHLLPSKPGEKERKYTQYLINTPPEKRIRSLHVGMITTRFIGPTDGLHTSVNPSNAGMGHAWLKIHNLTDLPLKLNKGEIEVPPHSAIRYKGPYFNSGVTLGTYFRDDDGRYPDFQYLQPHTDLYYGLVSDVVQPLYGCFQLSFFDQCDYGQTLWPFQIGVL